MALAQRRGRIRVGSLAGANADHFTLFGGTFGVAAELNVSQSWALFAKARYFNLGPSDGKSEGQHVDGVIVTAGGIVKF